MTTIGDPGSVVVARHRWLHAYELAVLLLVGDLTVGLLAVIVAMRLWAFTAGISFTEAVRTRAYWFLAVPAWLVALAPARDALVVLAMPQTLRALARLVLVLVGAHLATYFYAPARPCRIRWRCTSCGRQCY